ncbi:MAG: right-handed parallel beta-helix repeat-containing protein, partial [Algibacter sp.]
MKMNFKTTLLVLILMVSFISCNNEELFVEPIIEEVLEDKATEDEVSEGIVVDTTLPCDFDLNDVQPNSTIIINCVLDLDGETITLPANVIIEAEGGDIVNGTINFGDNNIIGGGLLNSTLTIGGVTPQLKDTSFNFEPEKWGIIEGIVSDDVAYNNKIIINEVIQSVKDLGITTIKIDALDAFFQTEPGFNGTELWQPQLTAIQVPSNIHLIMTDDTHLRVQPNDRKNTVLLTLFMADNSIVEGGVLHGDRDTHDYSDTSTSHEWGHLILVKASKNATVKGMTIMDAGGDGIDVNSLGHTFLSSYVSSENILITNNKIIRARRNGMSITDGKNIIIENNEIIDTGLDTEFSEGTAPRWAIDIEPVWGNGGIHYEEVNHVIIRNNIERGSAAGGFINARGSYITYENNYMESTISIGYTTNSIVRNNTFVRNPNPTNKSIGVAIYAGDYNDFGYNHSNEVYGNTITDFSQGIWLMDSDMDIHHNTLIDCGSGIQILHSRNSKIRDNTIINETGGEGISNKTTKYMDNVDIYNNIIKVGGSPFRFTEVNWTDDDA